jgi:hypothetical protein
MKQQLVMAALVNGEWQRIFGGKFPQALPMW